MDDYIKTFDRTLSEPASSPPSPATTPADYPTCVNCEQPFRATVDAIENCGCEPLQASSSSAPTTTTCEHCKQAANLLGDGVQCFTPSCPNRREEAAPIRTEVEAEAWMQNAPDGLPMREGQAEHWAKATKDIADRFDVRDLRDALAVDFALRTAKALPHLVAALRAASARYVRAEQELDEADAELAEASQGEQA